MDPMLIIDGTLKVLNALFPVVVDALKGGRTTAEITAAARGAVAAIRATPVDDAVEDAIKAYDLSHPAVPGELADLRKLRIAIERTHIVRLVDGNVQLIARSQTGG